MRVLLRSMMMSALLLQVSGCGRSSAELEPRSPVRGEVTVAGQPAIGLIVRFNLNAGSGDPRAQKTVEVLTDAQGKFRVSQNAPYDGLAPGKYTVTFFWPHGGDPEAPANSDQLKGRYLKPETCQFHIEVLPQSNELPPFALK